MQNDKKLFELIKENYDLQPNEEFIKSTEDKLKESARRLNRKRLFKRLSIVSSGLVISAIAVIFILSSINKDTLNTNAIMKSNSASVVKNQKPLVYIYHTHNYESFYSEIGKNDSDSKAVMDPSKNITSVGKKLSRDLEENNIKNVHDNTDIMGILKNENLRFYDAYTVSRKPLEEALKKYTHIQMVFDIHRDSLDRKTTTINIKGTDYSKILFEVSKTSNRYDNNLKFAEQLHNEIEKKYPGLSRGVVIKSASKNQNTYNQELMDQSVLLEIGGVENTLEEEYRTADILSEAIENIIKNN